MKLTLMLTVHVFYFIKRVIDISNPRRTLYLKILSIFQHRSIVTLYNRKNHAADFTWSPILSDRGTAFSIRPATGTVEAFKELKCEVLWYNYFTFVDSF